MMKRFTRLVSILLVITVLALPLTVVAQDEVEGQEFVSEDEMITFSLPVEWNVGEVVDAGFPVFAFANSEELIEVILDQESDDEAAAEPGQIGGQMLLLPLDLLILSGMMELPEDVTAEEIAIVLVDLLYGDEDTTEEVGEPVLVEIDEDREVVIFPVTNEEEAKTGIAMIYEVTDGIFAVAAGSTYIDEYDEDLEAAFIDLVSSVEYAGTSNDLMLAIMNAMSEVESE